MYPGVLIHRFNQSRVKNNVLTLATTDSQTQVENTTSFQSTVRWICRCKGPIVESKAVHRFSTVCAVALTDEREKQRRREERKGGEGRTPHPIASSPMESTQEFHPSSREKSCSMELRQRLVSITSQLFRKLSTARPFPRAHIT